MKRIITLLSVAVLLFAGCGPAPASGDSRASEPGPSDGGQHVHLVVGAVPTPHAEILNDVVKPMLAKKGIDIEVKEFEDYIAPNEALSAGDIDANYFQHVPYLDDWNQHHGTNLIWLAKVHIEPMGVYSKKISSLDQLKDGDAIGIPNSPTSVSRALLLLQTAGLIQLKDGGSYTSTVDDVVANPKHLKFEEIQPELLPRSLDDLAAAAINGNYVLEAKEAGVLKDPKPLVQEGAESPFANVLAVRAEDKGKPALCELAKALVTPEVKDYILQHYTGTVVPAQSLNPDAGCQ